MENPHETHDRKNLRVELSNALAREEATREILDLLIQCRDDEHQVFDAVLRNATRLCNAPIAGLFLVDSERKKYKLMASRGAKAEFVEAMNEDPPDLDPELFAAARSMIEQRVVHVEDLASPTLYGAEAAHRIVSVKAEGIRTALFVPLIWNKQSIGGFGVWRREVRPFSADEIALVETFAAQAVIAIENVRQFREVQTRLEREKASREILQIISRSRDDEQPVFEAILSNACRLCNAPLAFLSLVTDQGSHFRVPAHRGAGSEMAKVWDAQLEPLEGSALTTSQAIKDRRVIHVDDLSALDTPDTVDGRRAQLVELERVRTYLVIPLIRDEQAIGTINLYRREVHPFTSEQVELVETFAAQAVIAIENVRQFREVQARLERERASREILQVVSESREDEAPVFQVILENAALLCGAIRARLMLIDEANKHLCIVATWGEPNPTMPEGMLIDLEQDIIPVRAVLEKQVLNVPDARESRGYKAGNPLSVKTTDDSNTRSVLAVPLAKDDLVFGCIAISDPKLGAFNENDVLLVQNFAAQAVIAIENVRQFRALQDKTREVQALNASLAGKVEEQVGEIERMGRLKRFLPSAVADTVVSSGSEKILSSHRALLGVLFCDIRGFTAFCETAEPEETIEVLQTYHEEMGKLINCHGAGVDHRMGDGIMVLFNDPLPCDDPAGDAVRLALAMQERMSDLCKSWKRMGYRLGFGVGVSLGYATVGMVGFEGRFDYTASGTAINLASRLCDEAEDGEVLLSPRAAIAVEDVFQVESRGELNLKGLREPLEVFRLVDTETT